MAILAGQLPKGTTQSGVHRLAVVTRGKQAAAVEEADEAWDDGQVAHLREILGAHSYTHTS
jgi:hypothetical protein